MSDKKRQWIHQWIENLAAIWGGSLGFVVGAAAAAWFGKLAGWWPPSEAYLKRASKADKRAEK